MTTDLRIINRVRHNFSLCGNEGISIRKIASDLHISQSVIYYYFSNKIQMIEKTFDSISLNLGKKRASLPQVNNVKEMLKQRINFQFDNAEDVIFILKYYTHFRKKFKKNDQGYVPTTAYKHISELLERGINDNVFKDEDVNLQAKTIAHSVNGFILEYYPKVPSFEERKELVDGITEFIYRGIKKKGGVENG